jgi:protein phosphatase 2C family protein 2/3
MTFSCLHNYEVFDGHGGKDDALYVRDNLPRVIVEDASFPLELEKVVRRSFAEKCSVDNGLSSGTTALTAMIFGRYFFCHTQSRIS